ncbi:hypothetical protein Gohar_010198, partial [Gossypium harknessii]|nr:hypothetical protein [Gossypium harknessii]
MRSQDDGVGSPDLVGLLETRVSGDKADSIIVKLSFQYSHCVEAMRFSGGFGSTKGILFMLSCKRRLLSGALESIISVDGTPWLAIGNFNAILASNEKKGGGPWEKGRREVFERLDRAICNDAWSMAFSYSMEVYGHISLRKRQLIRKLNNVQKALDGVNSAYLSQVEIE